MFSRANTWGMMQLYIIGQKKTAGQSCCQLLITAIPSWFKEVCVFDLNLLRLSVSLSGNEIPYLQPWQRCILPLKTTDAVIVINLNPSSPKFHFGLVHPTCQFVFASGEQFHLFSICAPSDSRSRYFHAPKGKPRSVPPPPPVIRPSGVQVVFYSAINCKRAGNLFTVTFQPLSACEIQSEYQFGLDGVQISAGCRNLLRD